MTRRIRPRRVLTAFSVDQVLIESWSRNVSCDTAAELQAVLDSIYLTSNSTLTWSNLTGLPPTFADGVDNDTLYTAGNGMALNGTSISVNQSTIEGWARESFRVWSF
jgi:hypothetical protein